MLPLPTIISPIQSTIVGATATIVTASTIITGNTIISAMAPFQSVFIIFVIIHLSLVIIIIIIVVTSEKFQEQENCSQV